MRRVASVKRGERGQAIVLFVGVLTVIFVIAAIVVDVGLWLGERASAQRAADLAALAGSQDLPLDDTAAVANALEWAKKNGYEDGANGVDVTVELLCKNTFTDAPEGICTNTNAAGGASACSTGSGCDSMRVIIRVPGARLFTGIFGMDQIAIASGAAAGLDVNPIALDAVVMLDATGSMFRAPCTPTQDNDGCPIKEARDAANKFIDILLGRDAPTKLGFAPYRGCYNPPRLYVDCVPASRIVNLSGDAAVLHDGVNQTAAIGGTGTNVCLALRTARDIVLGPGAQPGSSTQQFVVILTDGDNTYNNTSFGEGQPPAECAPLDPAQSDGYIGTECHDAQPKEQELDQKTVAIADQLKAQGVAVYAVGFAVCGTDDGGSASDAGYCAGVGDGAHDNVSDQRLLKCIVSAPGNYHRVTSAQELENIFELIAWEIVGRGLVQ